MMNYVISKFKNNISLLSITITLLPISIIIGNLFINFSCLLIIILGVKKFNQEFIKYLSLFKFHLAILLVFFILNISFTSDYVLTLKGILGLIKYILLSSIIFFWLKNNKNNLFIFLFSILFCVLLVATSIYIEFFIKLFYLHVLWDGAFNQGELDMYLRTFDRFSGIFFDEKVAGSFISKFLIGILVFLVLDIKKLKLNRKIIYLIVGLCFFGILLSFDRSPFILSCIGLSFFLFFTNKIKFFSKFIIVVTGIIIIIASYNFSPQIKLKVNYTFYELGFSTFEKASPKKINFLETKYGSHFITAYEMGKKNFIIGNGIKTFGKDCGKDEFLSKKFNQGSKAKRCATHPHNIYLQLFAEAGILGLLIFLYFHFIILKKTFSNKNKELKIISLTMIIILFLPLQTSGSYFSTFSGIFYFLNISIINFLNNKKKIIF